MIKPVNAEPSEVLKKRAVKCELNKNTPGELLGAVIGTSSTQIWNDDVVELVNDLKETAASLGKDCIGLASNQIWDKDSSPLSIFVLKVKEPSLDPEKPLYTWKEFINPEIKTSGRTIKDTEACFSKPGKICKTKREENVKITYYTLDSAEPKVEKIFLKHSFAAIAIQHEYDHLCGKLI